MYKEMQIKIKDKKEWFLNILTKEVEMGFILIYQHLF